MTDTYKTLENLNVLANGAQLVADIVTAVAGDEVSNHIDGELISKELIGHHAIAAFNKAFFGVNRMLNSAIVYAALPLAIKQSELGVQLRARDDTALDFLTKACAVGAVVDTEGNGFDQEALPGILLARSEIEDHTDTCDAVVRSAAQAVTRLVGVARRIVMPDVKVLYEKVKSEIDLRLARLTEPYAIEAVITPPLLKNPLVLDQLEKYENAEQNNDVSIEFPALSKDEIRQKIATGNVDLDKQVLATLGEGGLESIGRVWEGSTSIGFIEPDYCYALYLLARAMYDEPQEGVKLSLSQYNAQVSWLIEQSALRFCASCRPRHETVA